ncbi:oxidoreductase [Photobacterium atrarenae]|uniref:Oxidoreductase n=1 Tax=Photobacterium atrarenae TaxID=865757 RepID=A0ABY5GJV1_9GAMM|nr:oxidoreductase [Photobacterium atrarenae]UTV28618.1 oxidoreductase [Photobacterium atrarenae]
MSERLSFFYDKFLLIFLLVSNSIHGYAYETTLTLTGTTTAGDQVTTIFTREQLEQLPQSSITTHLPWITDQSTFTGVKLSALLAIYNLQPSTIHLRALNDYATTVSWTHIRKYEPIIATRQDNQPLRIRDYGPYWLIFSIDQYPELNQRKYQGKMVWQLETITTE